MIQIAANDRKTRAPPDHTLNNRILNSEVRSCDAGLTETVRLEALRHAQVEFSPSIALFLSPLQLDR
ncbi:MAG: hypothetical protein HC793_00420 [Aquincola sp.]|nr:hypothetical protein [Aquincola sp.]